MVEGTDEDLRQTKVTQPAVFLHSVISALCMGDAFQPEMTAGHSLGEFSALVAAGRNRFGGEVTMAVMTVENGSWEVEKIVLQKERL